jgi:hypothetical protein
VIDITIPDLGIPTAALAASVVTSAKIADSAVTEANLGSATASNVITGAVACKTLNNTGLLALLTGGAQNVFALKTGDYIIGCELVVKTAATGACTLDVGEDATLAGGAVVDAFFDGENLQTAAGRTTADSATGQPNARREGCLVLADGYITLISSADIHTDATLDATLRVYYIPA